MSYCQSARGCSSVVRAPACHAGGRGFKSRHPRHSPNAAVAQLVEQRTENPWVAGSSPACGTIQPIGARILLSLILLLACVAQSIAARAQATEAILPGDVIRVSGTLDPAYCREFNLDANGVAEVGALGSLELGGLSDLGAAKLIREGLESLFGARVEEVRVQRMRSASTWIHVSGSVRWSGDWPSNRPLLLSELLVIAEPTASADLRRVEVRARDGRSDVHDCSQRDPLGSGVALLPGDSVVVPSFDRAPSVLVLGAVRNPGVVSFRQGMTVRSAIQLVGGLASNANSVAVKLERRRAVVDTVNLELGYDAPLLPGDVVRVDTVGPARWVHVVGGVVREGSYPFRPGMTASQAVAGAGGLASNAVGSKSVLVRRREGVVVRSLLDLDAIRSGAVADPRLEAGDLIEVGAKAPRGSTPVSLLRASEDTGSDPA